MGDVGGGDVGDPKAWFPETLCLLCSGCQSSVSGDVSDLRLWMQEKFQVRLIKLNQNNTLRLRVVPRAGLALKRHVIEINGKNPKLALCVSGKVSGAFLQCPIKALNMSE